MKNWQMLKSDPKMWERFYTREKIVRSIREFFYSRSYHEVETPLLVPAVIPESYLENFTTTLLDRSRNKTSLFLTSSPEASMKKLIAAGMKNCFEITKSFRNGETDSFTHNPEFSILEWYQIGDDYKAVMDESEKLIRQICKTLHIKELVYQDKKIEMNKPFIQMSVMDAFKMYANISLDKITNKDGRTEEDIFDVSMIASLAQNKGYHCEKTSSWEQLFNQIFLNEVQPRLSELTQPIFLYDYPKPMAALAKTKTSDDRFAERFELYIAGLELGDCYTELTDATEQKQRFRQSLKEIDSLHKQPVTADQDFLDALKIGLPACAGMAMGIDRIVMLFTDAPRIRDVIFFPLYQIE